MYIYLADENVHLPSISVFQKDYRKVQQENRGATLRWNIELNSVLQLKVISIKNYAKHIANDLILEFFITYLLKNIKPGLFKILNICNPWFYNGPTSNCRFSTSFSIWKPKRAINLTFNNPVWFFILNFIVTSPTNTHFTILEENRRTRIVQKKGENSIFANLSVFTFPVSLVGMISTDKKNTQINLKWSYQRAEGSDEEATREMDQGWWSIAPAGDLFSV